MFKWSYFVRFFLIKCSSVYHNYPKFLHKPHYISQITWTSAPILLLGISPPIYRHLLWQFLIIRAVRLTVSDILEYPVTLCYPPPTSKHCRYSTNKKNYPKIRLLFSKLPKATFFVLHCVILRLGYLGHVEALKKWSSYAPGSHSYSIRNWSTHSTQD